MNTADVYTELVDELNRLDSIDLAMLQRLTIPSIGGFNVDRMPSPTVFALLEKIEELFAGYTGSANCFLNAERQISSNRFVTNGYHMTAFATPVELCLVYRQNEPDENGHRSAVGFGGLKAGRIRKLEDFIAEIVDNTTDGWAIYQKRLWLIDEVDNVTMNIVYQN